MHRVALLGLFALGFVLNANSSQANEYSEGPWCARFSGGNDYIENCSMRSFAMCLTKYAAPAAMRFAPPIHAHGLRHQISPAIQWHGDPSHKRLPAAKRLK